MASSFPSVNLANPARTGSLDSFPINRADSTPNVTTQAGDHNNFADALNKLEAYVGIQGVRQIFDATSPYYGMDPTKTDVDNGARLSAAMTDAATVYGQVYVRPSVTRYACTPIVLPSKPFEFCGGGGGGTTQLYFPNVGAGNYALTYNPAVAAPTDPTTNGTSWTWHIHDLSFIGVDNTTAGGGWNFPQWTVNPKINLWAERCEIAFFWDIGVNTFFFSGGTVDCRLWNLVAHHIGGGSAGFTGGPGFQLGSDCIAYGLEAFATDKEGIYWPDARTAQLIGAKTWDTGKARSVGRTAGVRIDNGGTITIHNLYTQDTVGPGLYIHNANDVQVNGLVCDRTNSGTANFTAVDGTAALLIDSSINIKIRNYAARKTNGNYPMAYALNVTNSSNSYSNLVDMVVQGINANEFDGVNSFALGAVDPNASLDGTHVNIGASDGGTFTPIITLGAVTPDPYKGHTQILPIGAGATGIVSVTQPAHSHRGAEMRLLFSNSTATAFAVSGFATGTSGYRGVTGSYSLVAASAGIPSTLALDFIRDATAWTCVSQRGPGINV